MEGTLGRLTSIFTKSLSRSSRIGLSVGTSSVKIAETVSSKNGIELSHFGMTPLSENAVVNREIVHSISVIDAIKNLSDQMNLKQKRVCTSISGSSVIIKRMQIDTPKKKSETQEQVFWEAEQYLPFDISEVVMDYHLIDSKEGKTDVLLVAVKKNIIENYLQTIKDSGFDPSVIDVDFFALQNTFQANYDLPSSQAVALVDVGASSTKIMVVQGEIPLFTKDSVLGGMQLTQEIQKQMNLSFQDAEALKVSSLPETMPQELGDLMIVHCEALSVEIKRGLDFYSASSSGAPVTKIYLTGGGTLLLDLKKIIQEKLSMQVEYLNPFQRIQFDESVFTEDYLRTIAPFAAIPIGLSIRAGEK